MKRMTWRTRMLLVLIALTVALAATTVCAAQARPRVHVLSVTGPIDMGLAKMIKRGINEARDADADAVVVEIDTPGGLVDAALKIRDAIVLSGIRTIAYVDPRAWSAGALVAIACDEIAVAPGASMGAAETRPKEEKYISALRAEFESTAQMRGRDPEVAAAMVDADVSIPGLVGKGKILTLTANKAVEIGFVDYSAPSRRALLEAAGLADAEVYDVSMSLGERFARVLANEVVSGVLLSLGLVGLGVELVTPGFGVPGTIGLTSLALFFAGRMTGGAGWEAVIVFLIGLGLLLLEAFVIPGFGIAGILGIASVLASIMMSYPTPAQAMSGLAVALLSSVVLVALTVHFLSRLGRKGRGPGKLVLEHTEDRERGYVAVDNRAELLGKYGTTLTPLRPVGTVDIEGRPVDALSEGAFVPAGVRVRVIKTEGSTIVVRATTEE